MINMTLISFSLISIFSIAQAGVNDCDGNSLHCAYITGLSGNLKDGRYIKLKCAQGTTTFCTNNTGALQIFPEDAPLFLGNNQCQYFICQDSAGNDCKQIGSDNFTVTQNGKQYSVEPKYFEVDVSSLKNSFKTCDPTTFTRMPKMRIR